MFGSFLLTILYITTLEALPYKEIDVGVLAQLSLKSDSREYNYLKAGTTLARDTYNNLLQDFGYSLKLHYVDSGCNATLSTGGTARLISNGIAAIIGPSCSAGCIPTGHLSTYFKIPMISQGCSSSELSNKNVYPMFGRTIPFAREIPHFLGHVITRIAKYYSWDTMGIVYSNEDTWFKTHNEVFPMLEHEGFEISLIMTISEFRLNMESAIRKLKTFSRVILFFCYEDDVAEILTHAHINSMYNGDYAFITVDFEILSQFKAEPWFKTDRIYEGLINIGVKNGEESLGPVQFIQFKNYLQWKMLQTFGHDLSANNEPYYQGAAYIYDAVKGYILALRKTLDEAYAIHLRNYLAENKIDEFLSLNSLSIKDLNDINGNVNKTKIFNKRTWLFPNGWSLLQNTTPVIDYTVVNKSFNGDSIIKDGIKIINNFFNLSFQGMSGYVRISNVGDRYPHLIIDNIQRTKDSGYIFIRQYEFDAVNNIFLNKNAKQTIVWPGGSTTIPKAVPECGFVGDLCIKSLEGRISSTVLIAALVSPIATIILLYITYRFYKKYKYEADLKNKTQFFKFKDLDIPNLPKVVKPNNKPILKHSQNPPKKKHESRDTSIALQQINKHKEINKNKRNSRGTTELQNNTSPSFIGTALPNVGRLDNDNINKTANQDISRKESSSPTFLRKGTLSKEVINLGEDDSHESIRDNQTSFKNIKGNVVLEDHEENESNQFSTPKKLSNENKHSVLNTNRPDSLRSQQYGTSIFDQMISSVTSNLKMNTFNEANVSRPETSTSNDTYQSYVRENETSRTFLSAEIDHPNEKRWESSRSEIDGYEKSTDSVNTELNNFEEISDSSGVLNSSEKDEALFGDSNENIRMKTVKKLLTPADEDSHKDTNRSDDTEDRFETSSQKNLIISPSSSNDEKVTQITKTKKKASFFSKSNLLEGIGTFNYGNGNRTFIATLKNEQVFVKQIPKSMITITRDILVELKEIRDLQHINLSPYTGICIGPPYVLLTSARFIKGSIYEALQNEDIPLNWNFRYTFMTDIIQGLQAIHDSSIKFHGHLTSKNILIDERWNCKISDYGLRRVKDMSGVKQTDLIERDRYENLLWTAPELLSLHTKHHTKAGDIYSFGIIMSELMTRQRPYASYTEYSEREYICFIHKRCIPPFRPHVPLQTGMDTKVVDIMKQCWDEFPENRPSIHMVKSQLKQILPKSNSQNLLDELIVMIENYTQSLESHINDLNREKRMEREKLNKLLYTSLPGYYIKKLKEGQTVSPAHFEMASVLIFEVYDFSSLIETLKPSQIIDVLHDIQKIIDQSKDKNVVQLVGYRDHHVLVSGLPESCANKHGYYIARVAMKIMGCKSTFKFRHVNANVIKFKIVLHSGPFVAGLVGMGVPVFTLLGKTIDHAEKILQEMPPSRIFISNTCRELLDIVPGSQYKEVKTFKVPGMPLIDGEFLLTIPGVKQNLYTADESTDSNSLARANESNT